MTQTAQTQTPAATATSERPNDFQRLMQQPMNSSVISVQQLYSNMDATWQIAKVLAAGCGLGAGNDWVDVAMARIFIGAEMGIGPAASVRGIHFIKGRVALSADLMIAISQSDGWKYLIEHSDPVGEWCKVTASKAGENTYSMTWNMEMARKAGLVQDASGWKKYPHDMLYARAGSHVARKVSPARLLGIYPPEEIRGMEPEVTETAPPVVTPPAPLARPQAADPWATEPARATFLSALESRGFAGSMAVELDAKSRAKNAKSEIPLAPEPFYAKALASVEAGNFDRLLPKPVEAKPTEAAKPEAPTPVTATRAGEAPATTPGTAPAPHVPNLSSWGSFLAEAGDVAGSQGVKPSDFTSGIAKAVAKAVKTGKEDTISIGLRKMWYDAIVAKEFDFVAGEVLAAV